MTVDKSLLAGSTTMLVLKLLDGQDMYGYQMIEELAPMKKMRARRARAATTIWSARGNICCAKKKSNGRHLPLRSIAC